MPPPGGAGKGGAQLPSVRGSRIPFRIAIANKCSGRPEERISFLAGCSGLLRSPLTAASIPTDEHGGDWRTAATLRRLRTHLSAS